MDEKPNMFGEKNDSGKPTSKRSFPDSEKKTKARELSVADWGTPAEVREMSRMPCQVTNRKEVEQAIENIITKNSSEKHSFVNLISRNGLNAVLRKSSIGKLVSNVQKKNMPSRALWTATANIDKLFANAIAPWDFDFRPDRDNSDLKKRHVVYSPMEYEGRIIPTMIQVKEYKNTKHDSKLYSVEVIDFDIETKKEMADILPTGSEKSQLRPARNATSSREDNGTLTGGTVNKSSAQNRPSDCSLNNSIAHLFDSVKVKRVRRAANYTYGAIALACFLLITARLISLSPEAPLPPLASADPSPSHTSPLVLSTYARATSIPCKCLLHSLAPKSQTSAAPCAT
jgi:hypothetical protein